MKLAFSPATTGAGPSRWPTGLGFLNSPWILGWYWPGARFGAHSGGVAAAFLGRPSDAFGPKGVWSVGGWQGVLLFGFKWSKGITQDGCVEAVFCYFTYDTTFSGYPTSWFISTFVLRLPFHDKLLAQRWRSPELIAPYSRCDIYCSRTVPLRCGKIFETRYVDMVSAPVSRTQSILRGA